jgi:hypothetical protein
VGQDFILRADWESALVGLGMRRLTTGAQDFTLPHITYT